MPTILTHAAVPVALAAGLGSRIIPQRLLLAGIVASVLPDLDVAAFRLGIAYAAPLGHRGVSHSLAFAALLAVIAALLSRSLRSTRLTAAVFAGACAASHGVLDMFTNGGLGVALWWPFSQERVFAAWRVIEVSPLSLQRILGARGLAVMQSELLWVWLPALASGLLVYTLRRQGVRILVARTPPRSPAAAPDAER